MSIEHVRMRVAFLVFVLVAGCGEKRNPDKCLDGHCPDPSKPFCDETGEIGGEPGACVAAECSPGEFAACRNDAALKCNATGDNYDVVECMYGCSDAAGGCNDCNTPDCEKHIIPKYVPNECNQTAEGDALVISSSTTFNTDVECHSVLAQPDAPEICVIHRSAITIAPNQTLRIYGSRVVALVADRELKVEGVLDIGTDLSSTTDGPGGGFVTSGGVGTGNLGSGGAGFRTAGGHGATLSADGGGANGGAAQANPADVVQLTGGTAAPGTSPFVASAAGGGATLISCRGTVSIPGLVDANGGGGFGGFSNSLDIPPTPYPAAGGSSGGHLVLQGMNIVVSGQLFANGGGGGGGQGPNGENGGAGQRGPRAVTFALGGAQSLGAGGQGGFENAPPTNGKKPTGAVGLEGAGAGGGSVGFFQTYTPSGTAPMLMPTAVSPGFQPNRVIPTNR